MSVKDNSMITEDYHTSTHKQPLKTGSRFESKSERRSKIHFDDYVTVVPIPSHTKYSDETKRLIWSNSAEISMNAKRNLREFASEGWNWRDVVEEDQMFLDRFSDEFIHPVHLRRILHLR